MQWTNISFQKEIIYFRDSECSQTLGVWAFFLLSTLSADYFTKKVHPRPSRQVYYIKGQLKCRFTRKLLVRETVLLKWDVKTLFICFGFNLAELNAIIYNHDNALW